MFEGYFKRHYKAFLKGLFKTLFAREIQGIKSELELQQAELDKQRILMGNIARALSGMNVGIAETPKGSWIVMGYSQGTRDYVKFYDLGKTNVGSLRQMVEGYKKAGLAVLVEHPFQPFTHSKRSP